MSMKDPTLQRSLPATTLFGRLVEMCHATLNKLVPFGFEDDQGFHYGGEPPQLRHILRFHTEAAAHHSRRYRTRRARPSFHSYRIVTRDFSAH